jgi:lipoprotein-anchoring transpeptidase ErfK/SrfK
VKTAEFVACDTFETGCHHGATSSHTGIGARFAYCQYVPLMPVFRSRAPLALLAAVLATAAVVTSCTSNATTPGPTRTVTRAPVSSPPASASSSAVAGTTSSTAPSSTAATTSAPAKPKGKPVKVISSVLDDGSQVGVGLPIILLLTRPITSARAFAAATVVTVNGRAVSGSWYFERKYGDEGYPIEADYRTAHYWPGHAKIHLGLPVKGLTAGTGLYFANNLTVDFTTGAANILTVDNSTHTVTVRSDGTKWGTFPTSLGASATPTRRGVKVIMEKGASICMTGPGYHECGVQYTQRLTYDGEYLHAAPWNTYNIGHGINSSNGCTNLYTDDAKKMFDFLEIGDVVKYPNADGPRMSLGDGYGDWNLTWAQWKTGGLYPVT